MLVISNPLQDALLRGFCDSDFRQVDRFKPTEDDWNFIRDISSRFSEIEPSIQSRFELYLGLNPATRLRQAATDFSLLKRAGLAQRGFPLEKVQSVYSHSTNMVDLGEKTAQSGMLRVAFGDAIDQQAMAEMEVLKLIHDLGEVLTTDFTPQDATRISNAEKCRLEDLAMKIILEARPGLYEVYESYKQKNHLHERLTKVDDIIEWLADSLASKIDDDEFDESFENIVETSIPVLEREKLADVYRPYGRSLIEAIQGVYQHEALKERLREAFPDVQDRRQAIIDIITGHVGFYSMQEFLDGHDLKTSLLELPRLDVA